MADERRALLLETTSQPPVGLADVDAEFAKRWSWWAWTPDFERRLMADALERGDEERMALLVKVGERRGELRIWEVCYAVQEYRDGEGELVLDGEGRPIVWRWWGAKDEACVCVVRALESDAVYEFATVVPDGKSFACPRAAVTYAAQRWHEDSEWSAEEWVAAKRAEQEARAQAKPLKVPAAARPSLTETVRLGAAPPEDEEGGEAASPALAPLAEKPGRRWADSASDPAALQWRSKKNRGGFMDWTP